MTSTWEERETGELDESGHPSYRASPSLVPPWRSNPRLWSNSRASTAAKRACAFATASTRPRSLVEPVEWCGCAAHDRCAYSPGARPGSSSCAALRRSRIPTAVGCHRARREERARSLAMHSVAGFRSIFARRRMPIGLGADGRSRSACHFKLKDPCEPGSTFKTFIVATALDLGARFARMSTFPDGGSDLARRASIPRERYLRPAGLQRPRRSACLHSSNVVATPKSRNAHRRAQRLRAAMQRIGVWREAAPSRATRLIARHASIS